MNNNDIQNLQRPLQVQEESTIDIKALIIKFLSYWYLFVIFGVISLMAGYVYNKYKPNVYQVSATVYIKEQKMGMDAAAMMTGMNFRSYGNVDNEIGILKSYMLAEKALRKLDFRVSYYSKGRLATTELYKDNPFTVEVDYTVPQMVGVKYYVKILDNGQYKLSAEAKAAYKYDFAQEKYVGLVRDLKFEEVYNFGDTVDNKYNKFRIILNSHYNNGDSRLKHSFRINSMVALVGMMSGRMSVTNISKQASLLNLTVQGANAAKITDYLNQVCTEFIQRDLDLKNRVSDNTIDFIDNELVEIQESLSKAEVDLQNFQQGNDFMNLNTQANDLFNYLKEQEKRKAEMELNLKYYTDLKIYIEANLDEPDKLIAPSAMGIQDPLLNQLVSKLVDLSSKKQTQLITSTDKNPVVISLDQQIAQTKLTLLENINNIISNARLNIKGVNDNIHKLDEQVKELPETQRQLLGYQRRFTYNENIYNFLMQRRSEAQILKASNTPDNEIIDTAKLSLVRRVAPRAQMNYLVALVIGLLIPVAYILLRDFFNTKILERKDVENTTKFPIIGQIPFIETSSSLKTMVIASPKSPAAESFRSIRTNLDFILQGKEKYVFLVTGDMASVGKTYISINMASIYALYGKKTALVGFDLRKPRLYQEFGLSNKLGTSSYLANKASIDEIIQPSGKLPSLDIICAGPVPPNPAELIASDRCAQLFAELRERYDYIIVDTPPLALVTDAFLLMKHVDTYCYVVRQGVTNKKMFASIIKDLEERGVKMNIVINGIQFSGTYGYRYSYGYGGYGYGYGYGYGHGYGYGSGYYGSDDHHHGKKKREGLIARILRKRRE
ncbi:MAG: polysaccharide biosynthesis tyrosine autokinase [Bacteroidales bacterium]|nr:polysaccharide biosynthesis tyrosine autokinase [Bacteroidales bacterium]